MSEQRIERRAHLLPEEVAADSDDPRAQAAAILAESDQRTSRAQTGPDSFDEHRTSEQASS
jgi:hypothetical protein